MDSPPLVALRGLRWTPPGATVPLFDGIDVAVAAGETLHVTGPSGGGKSSLLRALARLLEDATGEPLLRGRVSPPAEAPGWRRTVGLVAQDPAPVEGTVAAELAFARALAGSAGLDAAAQAGLLARLDLDLRDDAVFTTLSGGERRRLALVRALTVGPSVLLLDEPTTGLDPDRAAALEALVVEWRDALPDRALVWVTHDAAQRERLGGRSFVVGADR